MLYLECYSGISGDMTVAALLDLGADKNKLLETLKTIPVDGYKIEIGTRMKAGVEAAAFDVILDGPEDGGSHDYVEQVHEHHHEHHHEHDHHHEHEAHEHHHAHHHGPHVHRNLYDVTHVIMASGMTDRAKETALRIFRIIAEAEAKVHAKSIEEVHFHEVGAVDSIVDICAAAICLDDLGISEVVISDIYEGSGHVHCAHGILPVPVPAVSEIAVRHGLYLKKTDAKGEMVTPTGAAIAAGIRTREALPESYKIVGLGMGSGKKEFAKANVLRAYLIEEKHTANVAEDEILCLETNIDDTTGEALGFVLEELMRAGALDACYLPAFMKKNRPAYLLKVLCKEEKRMELEAIIFTHTTTIGIRRYPVQRTVLEREIVEVETAFGKARVKKVRNGEMVFCYPEYEDVVKITRNSGRAFQEIYDLIRYAAEEK